MTLKTPPEKIPVLKHLLLYARELEMAGFATFTIDAVETDGTRWQVIDTARSQPIVTYLGPDPALLGKLADPESGKIPA